MDLIAQVATVLGLGAVELWAAIPAGLALGLHPVATGIASGLGALAGVLVVAVIAGRARAWLEARLGRPSAGRGHRAIGRIWDRFGVVGLGLLAPLLVGAPLGTALGVVLGAPLRRLLPWVSAGIVLWTVLLTAGAALGLAGLEALP